MYIKGFVAPDKMNDMIKDWCDSGVSNGDRLLQIATERDLSETKKLAYKIKAQENKAMHTYRDNKSVMHRAMDYCWRAKATGTVKQVGEAIQTAMEKRK